MVTRGHSWLLVRLFACVALAGIFGLGGQAARADDCQKRVSQADHRLHEAIEHRGYQSEEAEHARHELQEARERCWSENHRWWDSDKKRWHTERDWDDNDHRDYGHQDDDRR